MADYWHPGEARTATGSHCPEVAAQGRDTLRQTNRLRLTSALDAPEAEGTDDDDEKDPTYGDADDAEFHRDLHQQLGSSKFQMLQTAVHQARVGARRPFILR